MKKINLFELVTKAVEEGRTLPEMVTVAKAATDYTIGGTLQRTKALNLWDGLRTKSNLVARIRIILTASTTTDLSKYINQGVVGGVAVAATAMAAVRGGTAISGLTKKNIGNSVTQKEMYFLFNLVMAELAEYQQLGAGVFQSETQKQTTTDWANKLENLLLNGVNSVDEPNGIIPYIKANLATNEADELSGILARNVDTATMTTVTERLDAIIAKQLPEFAQESVILISYADYLTFLKEQDLSSNFSGTKSQEESIVALRRYKGFELVVLPYLADNNYVMTPLSNIALCLNMGNFKNGVINQEVPASVVYFVSGFWNFAIVTFNELVIGCDQT